MVALAASAAVALSSGQQLTIQRSANILNAGQAWEYALGAEAFARQVLRRDREDNAVDHPGEGWATLVPPTVIDGGDLFGRLDDLQGRFNLNNLVDANGPREADVALFQRLLQALELPPGLAWNVVDWLDSDQDPSPGGGAEDLDYLRRSPAYRSAGRPMASPSELLLIEGFDMASYRRLEPHLTALPEPTPLNVNTAAPELLELLAPTLSGGLAEELVDGRGEDGYASLDAFLARVTELAGEETRQEVAKQALAVGSSYFLFSGEARFGRGRVLLSSLLLRNQGGQVSTLQRARGPL